MPKIEQIPILLLTGFLGSGKTTLLARWLKAPEFAGAMVIVNELGEVGLDHRLVEAASDVPLLLENGCACCAAQEDLLDTLERLFWDRLHRRISRFEWVLIETTGMADPLPVIDAIGRHALLGERFRIAGIVTALDAKRGLERLTTFPECRNQLLSANAVIITKTDLASAGEVANVRERLPDLAPHAKVLMSANGDLPAADILSVLAGCAECGSHAHDAEAHAHSDAHGAGDHDHGHDDHAHSDVGVRIMAEHADGVTSAFLPLPAPVSYGALIAALETLMHGHADTLLRLKGLVRLEGAAGWHAIQATPGQGITRSEVPIEAGETPRAGFTLIAFHEPAAGIAGSLKALIAVKSARQGFPGSEREAQR
jgi:G3E family GTPase